MTDHDVPFKKAAKSSFYDGIVQKTFILFGENNFVLWKRFGRPYF